MSPHAPSYTDIHPSRSNAWENPELKLSAPKPVVVAEPADNYTAASFSRASVLPDVHPCKGYGDKVAGYRFVARVSVRCGYPTRGFHLKPDGSAIELNRHDTYGCGFPWTSEPTGLNVVHTRHDRYPVVVGHAR